MTNIFFLQTEREKVEAHEREPEVVPEPAVAEAEVSKEPVEDVKEQIITEEVKSEPDVAEPIVEKPSEGELKITR